MEVSLLQIRNSLNLYIYTYSIERLEKLKSNNGDEFASLNRTYKGEE
jgi:hypothetical protein